MEQIVSMEFTGLAKVLIEDESKLAEPDLLGVVPCVGDIVVTRDWPGREKAALHCCKRRLDLSELGVLRIHLVFDMAPPGSAGR